jgi:multidrug efflux pump subunit AcrB
MTIGVATANSILVVVFANDERALNKNHMEAALSAGYTRLRPVIMTALDDHRNASDGSCVR